ncbi:hypothetical protein NQ176_g7457 [Zarea fungicola]|uniref:Uncharacterized protein n=1 Tax=Zarea fungicola TaxID=93591 RepID=A0ACC1MZE4_9HYPO|nr:hypothetical protein NQ176_g7457 [Lecanicillium fungicola]
MPGPAQFRVLTLRNVAAHTPSPDRSTPKRTEEEAGLSPPADRTGIEPTTLRVSSSQPHIILGTPIPPTQQSLRRFLAIAPPPPIQRITQPIDLGFDPAATAFRSRVAGIDHANLASRYCRGGKDSQDDPAQAEARAIRAGIQRDHRSRRRAGETVSLAPSISQLGVVEDVGHPGKTGASQDQLPPAGLLGDDQPVGEGDSRLRRLPPVPAGARKVDSSGQFTTVVMLDEQMRAAGDAELRRLLKRIRQGVQDHSDVELLNARCYRQGRRIPWETGIIVVTPLNRNRWNLNMEASLAFQVDQRSTMRIFLSEHRWKDGTPTEEEATMMLNHGDDSAIPVPAVFMAAAGKRSELQGGGRDSGQVVSGTSGVAGSDDALRAAGGGYSRIGNHQGVPVRGNAIRNNPVNPDER